MTDSVQGASPFSSRLLLDYWKPIAGWENYEVSRTGLIRRIGKPFPLAGAIDRKGYRLVQLHQDGRKGTFTAHGLIAKHFIGPRPDGLVVNHLDGHKINNRASNLEYTTALENTRHAMRIGTYKPGTYQHQQKLDETDVSNIRELLEMGLYTTEIGSLYGIDASAISRIKNGKFKTRPKESITGHQMIGSSHPRSKLTEEDVMEIRRLRPTWSLEHLAQRFNVSKTNITDVALGNSWSHLPGAVPKQKGGGPRRATPTAY